MTPERIAKLRELADRGVGGEKENARAILTRLGIDWKKPKVSFTDKVKKTFGGDIRREYRVHVTKVGDILLMSQLLNKLCRGGHDLSVGDGGYMIFKCTQAEMSDISKIWNKYRDHFSTSMYKESDKYINDYILRS